MEKPWAVILAAGAGTRMNSSLPKVLHRLCGKPLLWHVLAAAQEVTDKQVIVTGFGEEQVRDYFGEKYLYVRQDRQLGTGHALQKALPYLPDQGEVLVLCGDTPLLEGTTLGGLITHHRKNKAAATVLTAVLEDPAGYGRVIRDPSGRVEKIVEELDADEKQKAVREINTGSYCFDLGPLKKLLPNLPINSQKGEYYLTDLIPMLLGAGLQVEGYRAGEPSFALGINDHVQLSEAAAVMRRRINEKLMRSGVAMIDPASVYIDAGVEVARDTVIYPQTILEGETKVGEGCRLGPGSHLVDTVVESGVVCRQSVVMESRLSEGAQVGPFANIRPGSLIGPGVKIGDFVEVKNSSIGRGSKVPHLSYVGDANIGSGVNMGAGCIVVNYDGKKKHRTVIEEGAFIGCNSNLVAPLTVGKGAFIGAGSTITRNVPADALSISRSRQENRDGLARKFLGNKEEK
ncbi:MAG: bifunctional UDP-N-acetylglucosamine diphosphorylase/glucosamine-1-phosphate N-acetyltransferase GlmU [Firmicutes bacterium]|nr:bifunctional UDP-N-acetylglucosamine diphosphorylase/glucosamine-1-phosphate N-acetyltransferase GlmU [Bacillota bacterium]